jgi:hypothetical protein
MLSCCQKATQVKVKRMEAGGFEPPDGRFCKCLPHKELQLKPCRHRHLDN